MALALAGVALPVTIGIAILRYQLFDIQLVLSRTLTYGVLVARRGRRSTRFSCSAPSGCSADSTAGGVLAVALVAVAVQPAYSILRRRIERWVYGYRADPAAALRRLGASLESADPLQVVEAITASVADALKVDRVWVSAPGDEAPGDPRVVRVPLVHRGELIGDLAVRGAGGSPPLAGGHRAAPRPRPLCLGHRSRGAAGRGAAGLAVADRHRSGGGAQTAAQRASRRRRAVPGRDPAQARGRPVARGRQSSANALLAEIRDETKAAITEVRRAVDELRPPAIDEVGLAGAIRQRAASLSTDLLVFRVDSPPTLPPIPAAVEVAAFRIASEAMTNVVKHSGASRCRVSLELDQTLELTISDNGRGSGRVQRPSASAGSSMTERAAELGGSCTISSRAEGGLVVRAVLPLREDVAIEVLR